MEVKKSPDLGRASAQATTATGFTRVGADTPSVAHSLGPMAIDAHAGAEYRNGRPESRIQVATQLMILFVLSHREPTARLALNSPLLSTLTRSADSSQQAKKRATSIERPRRREMHRYYSNIIRIAKLSRVFIHIHRHRTSDVRLGARGTRARIQDPVIYKINVFKAKGTDIRSVPERARAQKMESKGVEKMGTRNGEAKSVLN